MASYGHGRGHQGAPAPRHGHGAGHGANVYTAPSAGAPPGTFSPGTKIEVGQHRVTILKYLSEGGFAHVYLVRMPSPINGTDQAVLKRVAVPDKDSLRSMRIEVETMKRLKGHKPIVTYIDSHASELRGGGYEVFLLMEYCNGGGLIDFMNTRLQHRLTEPEILGIFSDVAEGVACMHYLKPPLLHRDLKVENVLITTGTGTTKRFKLCDFGSTAPPKPAPQSVVECRLMDEDVQKHTTLQYRSPEMVDVYRKQPIDEKSDIWALGVLLYKLCYYTTPFEDQGQLAILNASYKFHSHPVFSDRLKKLIASMLKEHPESRPNIYQVLREACAMQNRAAPIKDIYSGRSRSEPRGHDRAPSTDKPTSMPVVGAVISSPKKQQQEDLPQIQKMRRGRVPAAAQGSSHVPADPVPSRVTKGDPFAALDSKHSKAPGITSGTDELSSRFPSLDQFSLLGHQGDKFDFGDEPSGGKQPKDMGQRVAERLADEAFATAQPNLAAPSSTTPRQSVEMDFGRPVLSSSPHKPAVQPPFKPAQVPPKPNEMSKASAIISSTPELQALSQTLPKKSSMVSTGTMTDMSPPERLSSSQYAIYKFPPSDRHSPSLQQQESTSSGSGLNETRLPPRPMPSPRTGPLQSGHAHHPSSSRPSLEGARPNANLLEPAPRVQPFNIRQRPASTHMESNLDFLREKEGTYQPQRSPGPSPIYMDREPSPRPDLKDETNIESNVEFLRSMEESDPKKDHRNSKSGKRSSLSSISSGTKNILAGRFGDAFKRFEPHTECPPPARTPSPLKDLEREQQHQLTPIAGSEATDGRSDDGQVLEESEDMSPEQRREIERRRLSMEEKRVAAAGAEYRQRVAQRDPSSTTPMPLPKSIGGISRAVSIQNRVQSLLTEAQAPPQVTRSAEGYGRFADEATANSRPADGRPNIPRKPINVANQALGSRSAAVASNAPVNPSVHRTATVSSEPIPTSSSRPAIQGGLPPRPMAKPKPIHLNMNHTAGSLGYHQQQAGAARPASPPKPSGLMSKPLPRAPRQQLVAADLPGQPGLDMSPQEREDYLRDFTKRYPSLTAIEMVEADLGAGSGAIR